MLFGQQGKNLTEPNSRFLLKAEAGGWRKKKEGWCQLQDLNPPPPDYKSGALPDELSWHAETSILPYFTRVKVGGAFFLGGVGSSSGGVCSPAFFLVTLKAMPWPFSLA